MSLATRTVSLKERQRQERERLILRAAEELLLERGYHDMAIEDLAARVGISKGTVYLHFDSKEDLVLALFERGLRAFLQTLNATLDSAAAPREKLQTVFERVHGAMSARRFQLFHAIFHDPSLHSRLAETHQTLHELWDEPSRRVAALIEEGKASGDFDPSISTPVLLSLFWSLLTPYSYRRLIVDEHLPLAAVVESLSRFFFKGIAANPHEAHRGAQEGSSST